MRQPTAHDLVYAWHTEAMVEVRRVGRERASLPVHNEPQCGWFGTMLVRKGAWVPARVWLDQPIDEVGELAGDEILRCEVDGRERDAGEQWLFLCQQPISEREFDHMTALRRWQRVNAPYEYSAAWKPVDHLKTPISE